MRTKLWLAAAITVSGFTMGPWLIAAGSDDANSAPQPTPQQAAAQADAGVSGTRTLIADSTNAAVRPNGFGDFLNMFAGPTYNPKELRNEATTPIPVHPTAENTPAGAAVIASDKQSEPRQTPELLAANTPTAEQLDTLNERITQFREAFKSRYGKDFNIDDAKMIFADLVGNDLEAIDTRAAAAEMRGMIVEEDVNAGASMESPTQGVVSTVTGRDLMLASASAKLALPVYQGAPEVVVYLVGDGDGFRFATIHKLDERALAEGLSDTLGKLLDHRSAWPGDVNSAERLVGQHVLRVVQEAQRIQMEQSVGINTIRNGEPRR